MTEDDINELALALVTGKLDALSARFVDLERRMERLEVCAQKQADLGSIDLGGCWGGTD